MCTGFLHIAPLLCIYQVKLGAKEVIRLNFDLEMVNEIS